MKKLCAAILFAMVFTGIELAISTPEVKARNLSCDSYYVESSWYDCGSYYIRYNRRHAYRRGYNRGYNHGYKDGCYDSHRRPPYSIRPYPYLRRQGRPYFYSPRPYYYAPRPPRYNYRRWQYCP